jgi:hypothetical protein
MRNLGGDSGRVSQNFLNGQQNGHTMKWHVPSMFHNLVVFIILHNGHVIFEQWVKVRKTQKDLTNVPCKGEVKKRQKRPHGGGGSVRHLRQGNSQVGMNT